MSYHLYTTRGFVLGNTPFGEANTSFTLFTEELGLITASATSVRAERSKLRYGLQDFSFSEFTLVRGKETWRLASASLIENLWSVFCGEPELVQLFGRVFRLLRRLLPPEEKNAPAFEALLHTWQFLRTEEGKREAVEIVEIVLVLRILHTLGYLSPEGELQSLFTEPLFINADMLLLARKFRSLAVSSINHSLNASQL
ncbi:MAG: DNA repair protein RecO [bacterium]|nr:DNA repair protein RecO [bacterium]